MRRLRRLLGARGWGLTLLFAALVLEAAASAYARPPVGHHAGGVGDPEVAPAADRLVETTEVLPTYVPWSDGTGRVLLPGVHSTRRVLFDPGVGRTVGVRLALAEPLVVYSRPAAYESHGPRIALTFDDGPNATYTPQMLEVLRQYGARCTFFVVGGLIGKNRQLIERIEAEGHEVGIHSWRHTDYTSLSDGGVSADLARCRAALDPLLTRPVRWVRPPYGAVNARVRAAINAAGYHVAMWSVDPRDWTTPGSSVIANRVLSGARDGAVVVMHDGGGNRAGTVAAMRTVIPALQKRGFELVTMSELAGLAEAPPTEHGMVLTLDDRRFVVEADFDDMRVTVDGTPVELGTPPVRAEGQFLVHGRPVLTALGAAVQWRAADLELDIDAPRGRFVVRLNSMHVTRNGQEVFVRVPSVFYHQLGLLPVWLIANACGATVEVDEAARTIDFYSSAATGLGQASPRPVDCIALRGLDGMTICGRPAERWMRLSLGALGAHASVLL